MQVHGALSSQSVRIDTVTAAPGVFLPALCKEIQQAFQFTTGPSAIAEFDLQRGLTFEFGVWGTAIIDKFAIFNTGLIVDMRGPTETGEAFFAFVIENILNRHKIAVEGSGRMAFLSRLEVSFPEGLTAFVDGLADVGAALTSMVSNDLKSEVGPFEVGGLSLFSDPDRAAGPWKPARFVIERRSGAPFDRNIYFAEAPVRTRDHVQLLDTLSKALTT